MTIYSTPFNDNHVGVSVDSGFTSIDEVVSLMGDGYLNRRKPWVVYGTRGGERVMFSNFIVRTVNDGQAHSGDDPTVDPRVRPETNRATDAADAQVARI